MKAIQTYSLSLFLVLLLAPNVLQTAHIFADHQHTFCDHYAENHLHQQIVDCEISHFQQGFFPGIELFSLNLLTPEEIRTSPEAYSPDLRKDIRETSSVRGPPTII